MIVRGRVYVFLEVMVTASWSSCDVQASCDDFEQLGSMTSVLAVDSFVGASAAPAHVLLVVENPVVVLAMGVVSAKAVQAQVLMATSMNPIFGELAWVTEMDLENHALKALKAVPA